ncbi:MAG: prolyl oligopeptidase family serine peptidase [Acidobacteriota bacterium]|nr:MAG: prolyl oligopeptidase family serine peptidase [Acidobacteriota bacterium]
MPSGRARAGSYTIYIPSTYRESTALPLVVGLHGWTNDGETALRDSAFDQTAEEYGLITVWPDGLEYPEALQGWSFPGCNASPPVGQLDPFGRRAVCEDPDRYLCDNSTCPSVSAQEACSDSGNGFAQEKTSQTTCIETPEPQTSCSDEEKHCNWCGCADDAAFIRAVVEDVVGRLCIDRERIYLTGMSAGGMMTSWLFSKMPDLFAAFAPVSGPNPRDFWTLPAAGNDNTSILYVHGRQDTYVRHDGLRSSDGYYYEALWNEVARVSNHFFGRGCFSKTDALEPVPAEWTAWALPEELRIPSEAQIACRTASCERPAGDGREAAFCLVRGEHNWPQGNRDDQDGLWGNRLIVEFFLRHCSRAGNRCDR